MAWTRVTFNNAIAPGPKAFDFDVNQFSVTPERQQAVDFSSPYYLVRQTVIALKSSKIANAKSVADLKSAKLGAQVGTTSFQAVNELIKPTHQPQVYNSNDDAKKALENGQIDGLVVDLPTAFYITGAELTDGKIVGQLPQVGTPETFGLVLDKGSPLTRCVSDAVDQLRSGGQLAELEKKWLADTAGAPNSRDPAGRRRAAPRPSSSTGSPGGGARASGRSWSPPRRPRCSACCWSSRSPARRAGTGSRQSFLDPAIAADALPDILRGLWLNVRLLFFCALGLARAGPGDRAAAYPAAARCSSRVRALATQLHVHVPRPAADHRDLRAHPRRAGAAAAGHAVGAGARRRGTGAHVLRLPRRGVPRRHRVGAPQPVRGGPVARADLPPGDAPRGAAAGGPPGGAAAAQRHGGAAEGRRPGLAGGADRRGTRGADRDRGALQLHAVHRRGGAVRAARHPADRGHRLGDAAGRPPAGRAA